MYKFSKHLTILFLKPNDALEQTRNILDVVAEAFLCESTKSLFEVVFLDGNSVELIDFISE